MNHIGQPIIVKRINASLINEWEQELQKFDYSMFISSQWLRAVESIGIETIFLDFEKDGMVIAKLAGTVLWNGKIKGRQLYFYATPAILQENIEDLDECHLSLKKWATKEGFSRITLSYYDQRTEKLGTLKGYYKKPGIQYIINFNAANGYKKYTKGFRQNVRNAEMHEAIFKEGTSEEILDKMLLLMDCTHQHRVKKYHLQYKALYLKNLNKQVLLYLLNSGVGTMYYVELNGEIDCIQFLVNINNRTYALLIGSNQTAYQHGLAAFIDDNIIKICKNSAIEYYNLGVSPLDEGGKGMIQYKKSMGAMPHQCTVLNTNFLGYPRAFLNIILLIKRPIAYFEGGLRGFVRKLISAKLK